MYKYYHKFPFYITILCIFVPIIQVLIGYNLNRYILILSVGIFFLSFRIPKIRFNIFIIILIILGFIVYGVNSQRGFTYSANSAPLIFGLIFYIYFKSRIIPAEIFYAGFVSKIYKILLLFMLVEFVIANYNEWILFNYFSSETVIGYVRNSSKLSDIIGFSIMGNNSLYLGPQIYSMVAVSGIMWFYPYEKDSYNKINLKWFVLSFFLFLLGFSLTSIIMFFTWIILSIIIIPSSRSRLLPIFFVGLFFSIIYFQIFAALQPTGITIINETTIFSTNLEKYVYNFSEIIFSYFTLPINYKLFGIPAIQTITDYTASFEFGYFIRLMKLGLIFNLFIIGLNVLVLIHSFINKNSQTLYTKLNLIILSVWHISMIHYMPATKSGPAQLFGLHIALFIFFSQFTINNNYLKKSLFRFKNKLIPQF